jgi:hypothetical protein
MATSRFALRSRGWQQVDSKKNAHIIYTYSNNADWAATLKPWQRFNYIPGYRKWNKKDDFAYYYKLWEAEHKDRPRSVYVPETYLLTDSTEGRRKQIPVGAQTSQCESGQGEYAQNERVRSKDVWGSRLVWKVADGLSQKLFLLLI